MAAQWMGWKNIVSCEINPFCNTILKHYWPDAYHHADIKSLTYEAINKQLTARIGINWRTDDIVLSGGFPCQPYSLAGKRKGKEDDRHLWPEMLRVIREVQPRWVVGENVFGLINWDGGLVFEEVQADLEAEGYEVQPYVLPACGVNAPHRRDRIWFVAYTNYKGRSARPGEIQISNGKVSQRHDNAEFGDTGAGIIANACKLQLQGSEFNRGIGSQGATEGKGGQSCRPICSTWQEFPTQPPVCGVDDRLSTGLDGITFHKWRNESIKAYGNAVVPQVVYQIFKAIEDYENILQLCQNHGTQGR